MWSDYVLDVKALGKDYLLFDRPINRLLKLLFDIKTRCQVFKALDCVTFKLERGKTLGIIGRNGAGKSTLLQIICGTLTPTAGSVRLQGRVAALLELGAGFNPEFSGRENIYMNAAILGLSKKETEDRLSSIVDFAEIGDYIDRPVKTYSSGMFVRLAFAVIAHVDADVLIVDEALAVGDVYFTQKCMRFLREFKERGTLIFVSHDVTSVINLCDRVIWLDKGVMRGDGPASEIVDAYLASCHEKPSVAWQPEQNNGGANESSNVAVREFGAGGATILNVSLQNLKGDTVRLISGSQRLRLEVKCLANKTIDSPIIGFFIKDRLGQYICGDNTVSKIPQWQVIATGKTCSVIFEFIIPALATGSYSLGVALAEGTQTDHVQHHWIHDALDFEAQADPHMTGWFGLEGMTCKVEETGNLKAVSDE